MPEVVVGKGHTRQARTQIGDMVGIGNRIQTNQKASSGTRKAMVGIGKGLAHQTKSTNGIRSASTGSGKVW